MQSNLGSGRLNDSMTLLDVSFSSPIFRKLNYLTLHAKITIVPSSKGYMTSELWFSIGDLTVYSGVADESRNEDELLRMNSRSSENSCSLISISELKFMVNFMIRVLD